MFLVCWNWSSHGKQFKIARIGVQSYVNHHSECHEYPSDSIKSESFSPALSRNQLKLTAINNINYGRFIPEMTSWYSIHIFSEPLKSSRSFMREPNRGIRNSYRTIYDFRSRYRWIFTPTWSFLCDHPLFCSYARRTCWTAMATKTCRAEDGFSWRCVMRREAADIILWYMAANIVVGMWKY